MIVTGIIAECNPLHEGHLHLIKEARRITQADYILVALSGDYVQRGMPSVISREARAHALLRAGADLVVEIPLYSSCCGADYFARGAVRLLESTGVVTDLVFGSESGDIGLIYEAAERIGNETEEFRSALREGLRRGLTYPQARSGAVKDLRLPDTPNDLLAAEYLRALKTSGSSVRPHAVKRIACSSATEIRNRMIAERAPSDPCLGCDDFSDLLLEALTVSGAGQGSAPDLSAYLDVSPDLSQRITAQLPFYDTFTGFAGRLKTRNYTYTRISRALLHILLGMRHVTMEHFDSRYGLCGWIRPIGFRRESRPLLRGISANCAVPFLDKLSAADSVLPPDLSGILDEEIRAEFLYDLMAARRTGHVKEGVKPGPAKPLVIL